MAEEEIKPDKPAKRPNDQSAEANVNDATNPEKPQLLGYLKN